MPLTRNLKPLEPKPCSNPFWPGPETGPPKTLNEAQHVVVPAGRACRGRMFCAGFRASGFRGLGFRGLGFGVRGLGV